MRFPSRQTRRWLCVVALTVPAVLGTDLQTGDIAPAKAAAVNACDVATLPGKPVDAVGGIIGVGGPDELCDAAADKVTGAASGAAADIAGEVGGSVVEELARTAGEGAIWLMGKAKDFALRSTSPDVLDSAFTRKYEQMLALALVPALILLLVVAVESVGRSDTGLLIRTALVTTPAAMAAAAAAMAVVQLLIAGVDSMSTAIGADAEADMERFLDRASEAMGASVGLGAEAGASVAGVQGAVGGSAAGAAVPVFLGLVGAVLAVIAALVLWLELLFRAAAIYAVALFVPFSVLGVIWPRARAWMTRTVELILVLVFSKFVIVAILSLSGTLIVDAGDFAVVLQATMLLLLAAFSPLILLKLVPFVENAAGAVNQRSSGGVALSGMQTASSGQMMYSVARRNWGGGSGSIPPAGTSAAPPAGAGGSAAPLSGVSAGAGIGSAGGAALGAGALSVAEGTRAVADRGARSVEGQARSSGTAPPEAADPVPPRGTAPVSDEPALRPAPPEGSGQGRTGRGDS